MDVNISILLLLIHIIGLFIGGCLGYYQGYDKGYSDGVKSERTKALTAKMFESYTTKRKSRYKFDNISSSG